MPVFQDDCGKRSITMRPVWEVPSLNGMAAGVSLECSGSRTAAPNCLVHARWQVRRACGSGSLTQVAIGSDRFLPALGAKRDGSSNGPRPGVSHCVTAASCLFRVTSSAAEEERTVVTELRTENGPTNALARQACAACGFTLTSSYAIPGLSAKTKQSLTFTCGRCHNSSP